MAQVASPAGPPLTAQAPRPAAGFGLTIPLLIAGILTVLSAALIFFKLWWSSSDITSADLMRLATRQYALGHRNVAGELAARSNPVDLDDPEMEMQRHFLIGAGHAAAAADTYDLEARRASYHLAVKHLRAASTQWPVGRQEEGPLLLGRSLFEVGDHASAIPPLQAVLQQNSVLADKVLPMLARCLLRGEDYQVHESLELLDEYLSAPTARLTQEDELRLLRAEALTRLGRFEAAREQLEALKPEAPNNFPNIYDTAHELINEIDLRRAIADVSEAVQRFGPGRLIDPEPRPEVAAFLEPAMRSLVRLQRDGSPDLASRTGVWLARAMRCVGRPADALSQLDAVRLQQPLDGRGIAAGIEQAEYLAAMGNAGEAAQVIRYIVREIGSVTNFDGSVVSPAEFRGRVRNVLVRFRELGDLDAGLTTVKSLPPVVPLDEALYEEGLAYRAAADRVAPIAHLDQTIEQSEFQAARRYYGRAGRAFAESAQLRFDSPSYPETLWEAVDAFQRGGQFSRTIDLLSDYLRYEQRIRHPRALVAQGRAYLADGNPEAALEPLKSCIVEFPRDPLCFDARLLAALALAELDDLEAAKELLDANLTDGSLTPQSITWKESLYTLGEMLWKRCRQFHVKAELLARSRRQPHPIEALRENQPRIEEAIARLDEASARYWPDRRAMQVTSMLAAANRLAAELPRVEADMPEVLDATRRRLLKDREQFLEAAVEANRKLRKVLVAFEDERKLTPRELTLLQLSLLSEADTLYDLGRYEPAADIYRSISLRYMNEPIALEAMLGQSRCLRNLNRPREARMVLRQAAVILERIPPEWDGRFEQSTRHSRKGWEDLLTWLDQAPLPQIPDA